MAGIHQITRSNANQSNVSANQFPKSGFNLTYNSHLSAIIGRLHPVTHQWIMPSDKFSGSNEGTLTFNTITTPIVSDMYTSQHSFYMPFRAVDTDFEENITPTKLNAMGANASFPQITLRGIAQTLQSMFFLTPYDFRDYSGNSPKWKTGSQVVATIGGRLHDLDEGGHYEQALDSLYLGDTLIDLTQQLASLEPTAAEWDAATDQGKLDIVYNLMAAESDFFFGEGSLMDFLGYTILDHATLRRLLDTWFNKGGLNGEFSSLSSVPQLEYPLRIYYAIWYEYYRDVNLEPATTAPETLYRKWTSAPCIGNTSFTLNGIWLLITRIRAWEKDMFTTAEIDDISRHVFAPVFDNAPTSSSNNVKAPLGVAASQQVLSGANYLDAEQNTPGNAAKRGLYAVNLTYRDIHTGQNKQLSCPIPSGVFDSITKTQTGSNVYGMSLDLLQLKNAKMLESYLKRNFYFGDEYKDRMFAHYGSRVSDLRVNRPEYLGGSLDNAAFEQKVNGTATSEMAAGERTAVGGVAVGGDGFTYYAEEFGMYMCLLSVMPKAQYNPLSPQLLMSRTMDFPLPEFAMQQDECGRSLELYRDCDTDAPRQFGHYPYAHAWRSRVDEVHGDFLTARRHYTFARFWTTDDMPKLNYRFIHCRPNLGMFQNRILLDGQCYGTLKHNFFVERVLPTPVEII